MITRYQQNPNSGWQDWPVEAVAPTPEELDAGERGPGKRWRVACCPDRTGYIAEFLAFGFEFADGRVWNCREGWLGHGELKARIAELEQQVKDLEFVPLSVREERRKHQADRAQWKAHLDRIAKLVAALMAIPAVPFDLSVIRNLTPAADALKAAIANARNEVVLPVEKEEAGRRSVETMHRSLDLAGAWKQITELREALRWAMQFCPSGLRPGDPADGGRKQRWHCRSCDFTTARTVGEGSPTVEEYRHEVHCRYLQAKRLAAGEVTPPTAGELKAAEAGLVFHRPPANPIDPLIPVVLGHGQWCFGCKRLVNGQQMVGIPKCHVRRPTRETCGPVGDLRQMARTETTQGGCRAVTWLEWDPEGNGPLVGMELPSIDEYCGLNQPPRPDVDGPLRIAARQGPLHAFVADADTNKILKLPGTTDDLSYPNDGGAAVSFPKAKKAGEMLAWSLWPTVWVDECGTKWRRVPPNPVGGWRQLQPLATEAPRSDLDDATDVGERILLPGTEPPKDCHEVHVYERLAGGKRGTRCLGKLERGKTGWAEPHQWFVSTLRRAFDRCGTDFQKALATLRMELSQRVHGVTVATDIELVIPS